jgi:hypothetical protein
MKRSAITALAVGKNKHHDDVLLAVDRDGKIGKITHTTTAIAK